MPYRVENILRKEKIACYKQFPIFSQCYPQLYLISRQNAALCGKGLNTDCVVKLKGVRRFLETVEYLEQLSDSQCCIAPNYRQKWKGVRRFLETVECLEQLSDSQCCIAPNYRQRRFVRLKTTEKVAVVIIFISCVLLVLKT